MPSRAELPSRLASVLEALYLLFNEGYSAHAGEDLVRVELCSEALRLAGQLVDHPASSLPETHALHALMLLQSARLPARVDAAGELLTLEEQDRARWDHARLAEGLRTLGRSAAGDRLTPYHVEAAIAACHAVAPSFEETDWRAISGHYDQLLELKPTPVVALNRAVAVAMADGPERGLELVDEVAGELDSYHLLHAARADLLRRLGRNDEALAEYRRALELVTSPVERAFLEGRVAGVTKLLQSPIFRYP
jgi:RNA polymerase sigma-70 factor (ECF subfamily)